MTEPDSAPFGVGRMLRYAMDHPIGHRQRLRTLWRIINWQTRSRFYPKPVECEWIGGSTLLAERGMTGATGNLYFGLHEFADMAFVLHLLRPGDLFIDVGANIGSYTILAAKISGSRVIAFEPDEAAMQILKRNVENNNVANLVTSVQKALSDQDHDLWFSTGMETENHVLPANEPGSVQIHGVTLDTALDGEYPIAMKVDVEGHEPKVFAGAIATLSAGGLRAIESETVTPEMERMFADHGFVRRFYDPFSRRLSKKPVGGANNSLFIRDEEFVADRVATAKAMDIHGIAI